MTFAQTEAVRRARGHAAERYLDRCGGSRVASRGDRGTSRRSRQAPLPAEWRARPTIVPVDEAEQFRRVIRALRKNTGVDFSQYRDTTIKRRTARRMLVRGQALARRICGCAGTGPERSRSALSRRADQCHELFPRPGAVRRPETRRISRTRQGQAAQRTDPGLGAWLLDRARGLFDRDCLDRIPGRPRDPEPDPDFCDGPRRTRFARQGALRSVPGEYRSRGEPRTAAALFHARRP